MLINSLIWNRQMAIINLSYTLREQWWLTHYTKQNSFVFLLKAALTCGRIHDSVLCFIRPRTLPWIVYCINWTDLNINIICCPLEPSNFAEITNVSNQPPQGILWSLQTQNMNRCIIISFKTCIISVHITLPILWISYMFYINPLKPKSGHPNNFY